MLALKTSSPSLPPVTIDLPLCFLNFTRSSGVATELNLTDRKDGTIYNLLIVSNEPLRNHEVKAAIAKATNRSHWDFKHEFVNCSDYEF